MELTKEIIEKNILLAKFLGKQGDVRKDLYWLNIDNKFWVDEKELEFHNNWNWLMKVVEKIESIFNSEFTVSISDFDVKITGFEDGYSYFEIFESGDNKYTCVYNACVKFVEWYLTGVKAIYSKSDKRFIIPSHSRGFGDVPNYTPDELLNHPSIKRYWNTTKDKNKHFVVEYVETF